MATATTTVTQPVPPSILVSSLYLQARRPWLTLYNLRLRQRRNKDNDDDAGPSFLEFLQPELVLHIIRLCPPYALGRFACTCVYASELCRLPRVVEHLCLEAHTNATIAETEANADGMDDAWLLAPLLRQRRRLVDPRVAQAHSLLRRRCWELFRGSWRLMWLFQPRLRHDGVYVSRNTYVRVGTPEWRLSKHVNLVVYYRMYRFYADGTCVYRTTPSPPKHSVRDLHSDHVNMTAIDAASRGEGGGTTSTRRRARGARGGGGGIAGTHGSVSTRTGKVMVGRYRLESSGDLTVSIMYPGARPTEVRTLMTVRSTCAGAFNRLDVVNLTTEYEDPALAEQQRRARAAAAAAAQAAAVAAAVANPHNAAQRAFGGGAAPTVALAAAAEETPAELRAEPPAEPPASADGLRRFGIDPNTIKSYVFIPEEDVESHEVNKGADELDFYLPG